VAVRSSTGRGRGPGRRGEPGGRPAAQRPRSSGRVWPDASRNVRDVVREGDGETQSGRTRTASGQDQHQAAGTDPCVTDRAFTSVFDNGLLYVYHSLTGAVLDKYFITPPVDIPRRLPPPEKIPRV